MADEVARVAVLGTGIMGFPMARNLAGGGFDVRAWNRTRRKAEPLTDAGVTVCDTAAEAVSAADAVITMLLDADAVLDAVSGADGALTAMAGDAVWLQMSTVGVAGCSRLAAAARQQRVPFLDAPVLGTRKPAEDGTLKIFVAGAPALRGRVEPVLAALGTVALWFEDVGQASALKLVVNAWVLTVLDGTATSVALARGLGVDPQSFLDAIGGGPTDSPYAHLKAAMMIDGRYEPPSFTLSGALKDAGLILDAAAAADLQPAVLHAIREDLQRAADRGLGGQDMAAVYEAHGPSRA